MLFTSPFETIATPKHFALDEFRCKGKRCGCGNIYKVNLRLLEFLDRLREDMGEALIVTSGYRCLVHNKAVGGAANSQHPLGTAADIQLRIWDASRFAALVKTGQRLEPPGMGVYWRDQRSFCHFDVRQAAGLARWGDIGGKPREFQVAVNASLGIA